MNTQKNENAIKQAQNTINSSVDYITGIDNSQVKSLVASVTVAEIKAVATLSDTDRENLKNRIDAISPFTIFDLVEGKDNEIICPFCGSGTHDNHTGITPTFENGVWLYHCFANGDCEGTLISLIAKANNIEPRGKDFFKVLAIGKKILEIELYNVKADEMTKTKKKSAPKKKNAPSAEELEKFKKIVETAQKNLPAFVTEQGGKWRGLSLETLQQIQAGFLQGVYFPAAKKELPAVVIPNDSNGVYFRSIEGKFHKNNSPTATTTVFLPSVETFDLIVTEGQINAASIFESFKKSLGKNPKFGIIASGGTSGNENALTKIQELVSAGKKIRVLVAYDNDENNAGTKSAEKLIKQLKKAGIPAFEIDITKTADTDLNDILRQENGFSSLFDKVTAAMAAASEVQETKTEIKLDSDSADSDSKRREVKSRKSSDDEVDTLELAKERVIADRLEDPELDKFFIPNSYEITKYGIKKLGKKEIQTICPRPVLIKERFYNLESGSYTLALEYLTASRKWKSISPKSREFIFNKNKIVDLAGQGLPVTTGNSAKLVDFLFNLELENEDYIPLTYTVNRCGWYPYKSKNYFIDPRITNTVDVDGRKINIVVDSSNSNATALKTKGNLDDWKRAYNLAAGSPVARATIAASVAAPLLNVLGERNMVFYIHGKTRGGKSTATLLGSSTTGSSELFRCFDATNNGLVSAAADTNDYSFFVDEKQSADPKLKNDFQRWIYSDANGVERTRANKDGTARPARTWRHITICNGETELLGDNVTAGAYTRILQIHAPDTILDPDACREIRQIIKSNYGLAFPLFVEYLNTQDTDKLRAEYEKLAKFFVEYQPNILSEHAKYIALIWFADDLLNKAIGNDINPLDYDKIFECIPTLEEIDDTAREESAVSAFIAMKAAHFEGNYNFNKDRGLDVFGKHKDGYLYIIAQVLNKYLADEGFDYKKVVNDLVQSQYFIPADKVGNDRNKRVSVTCRINGKVQRCYKIKQNEFDEV